MSNWLTYAKRLHCRIGSNSRMKLRRYGGEEDRENESTISALGRIRG
jgi:hypothetical protein